MFEQKMTKSMVRAAVLAWLIAGLLVGCTISGGSLDFAHSYPAPSETLVGEIVTGTPKESFLEDPMIADQVEKARQDLAGRLSISQGQIVLSEVRQVTWPDSSLGCPQAGMAYDQESHAGLIIRFRAAGNMYFYHSDMASEPFLCENMPQFPESTPKYDELVPPPDHEID